jgi:type II secretory pathway pseudopilin PulG
MQKKNLFIMPTVGCSRVSVSGSAVGRRNLSSWDETNSRGITLVELAIVISVIATVAMALAFSYTDWIGKYKVEKVTKELYADLMNVRHMAMTRKYDFFADFNFPAPPAGHGTYRIAEDTDGDGEGDDDADGVIDAGGHTFLSPKAVEYAISNNFDKILRFDKRGIAQPGGTLCFFTDKDPDYDCIVISRTRINMGKLTRQQDNGGICNSENCATK